MCKLWVCLTHRARAPGLWLPASGFSPSQGVSSPSAFWTFPLSCLREFCLAPPPLLSPLLPVDLAYHSYLMLVLLFSETAASVPSPGPDSPQGGRLLGPDLCPASNCLVLLFWAEGHPGGSLRRVSSRKLCRCGCAVRQVTL